MKTKAVPSIIMLSAGFIRCVLGALYQQNLTSFLWSLIGIMILFYFIGIVVKIVLDKNFPPDTTEEKAEESTDDTEELEEDQEEETQEVSVKEKIQTDFESQEQESEFE